MNDQSRFDLAGSGGVVDILSPSGFEVHISAIGGFAVYPKARAAFASAYGSGNCDLFAQTWIGPGNMKADCPVWPVGENADRPTRQEQNDCIKAAKAAAPILSQEEAAIGPFHYGFHLICID